MVLNTKGTPFSVTATGTATATATFAAQAGAIFYITDVGASLNTTNGTITLVSTTSSGSVILWQHWLNGGAVPWEKTFMTPVRGALGQPISASVQSTGTLCYVNIAGFQINTP